MRGRATRRIRGAAIAGSLVAATLLGAGNGAVSASPTPAPARAAAVGCQRDAAADLRWVTWLYEAFLGRRPGLPQAAPWLAKLTDGASYRSIASAIATSDEAQRRIVTATFGRLLHRAPSAAELAAWAPWTRTHGPTALVGQLAASEESWNRAGGTPEGWLGQLYLDVLGRPADTGGLTYWTGRLAGGATLEQVAIAFWHTPSHVLVRVDAVYRAVLGRPADASGAAYWSAVAKTYGDTELGIRLALTQAAWNRAQVTYGGVAGPIPPQCPPPGLRWVPPPGSVVRSLAPVAHFGPRLVALTFDDGPDPKWTPQILRTLREKRVPATFFLVGTSARAHPELVRQQLAEGHRVGTHTMTHPNLQTLGADAQRREIVGSADLIEGIAGPGSVRCLRPGYGNYNATTVQIAKERGLAVVLWSRDGRDWAQPGVDTIVNGNLDTRFDGGRGVVILHDGGVSRAQTVAALPILIDALRARGYEFVQIC